ncbi:hypothetical protein [Cysteiniphilum halobium]|uniref:hypothetical protein n=1 Tax=Cysteiniphilum halobium TaxID=2219059 RepID=UPI003F86C70D
MKIKRVNVYYLALLMGVSVSASYAVPTSGDYVNDLPQTYTNNFTQETMDQINGILCVFAQTNYPEFTNQGAYLSKVDMNACNMGDERGDNSVPILSDIVGESTNVNGVQTVTFWIDGLQVGDGDTVLIEGKLVATETPTTLNPYGVFSLNYVSYPYVNGVLNRTTPQFRGFISASEAINGRALVKYFETEGNGNNSRNVALAFIQTAENTGYGQISSVFNQNSMLAKIAFNSSHLENLVTRADLTNGQAEICYDRNNYTTSVYRYGLYNPDGSRVNRNSGGFPVEMTINNETKRGWLSFYGLWLPGNPTVVDGTAATKKDMQTGASTAGTIEVGPGRLELQTARSITLGQLAGTRLRLHALNQNQATAIVLWNSTTQQFDKVGEDSCNQNGCSFTPISPAVVISNSDLQNTYLGQNYSLNVSIDGVGGGGFTNIPMRDQNNQVVLPTNSTQLVVWTNALVAPTAADETLTLKCYNNCPVWNNGLTQWETKYPAWDSSGSPNLYLTYTINKNILATSNAYTLLDPNGVPVTSETDNLWVGEMIPSTVVIGNNIDSLYNGTITQKYTWQSGPQPWNKFYTFKATSDNSISSFEPPISLTYNDGQGSRFIEYESFGQLNGIPGKCYSRLDNTLQPQCGGNDQIWVPDYNVPTGTELTQTANANVSYFVKQLGIAQNLLPLAAGAARDACISDLQTLITQAGTDSNVTLPTLSDWVDPNIGTMPNVGDIPRVIAGVTQPQA